ncbi:MORN repeat-containing protein [Microcoleus sp. FACHB-672]|uniref:MORN repeat-containing protein n=1 Tax=Microcoleus sp. FACHB-672 TaxID=2692825 RepID=UPI0016884336|nr:MORN motif-containing protein [Microcoleus sp. FACHB-672]MBD2042732.1 MORN motif-containing protein [Microcoleus sp. FACHB-672]
MPNSIQKLGLMILGAFVFEISGYMSPFPAIAQEAGGGEKYQPPYCEGNTTNGFVKCNYGTGANAGDNYVGNFANGVPNGRGVYVYASSGDRYEGEFRNGRPNGTGVFIFGASNARYEGTFRDGNIVSGKITFDNSDRYEGPFQLVEDISSGQVSSQPHGQGRFIFANGDRYEGAFFAGAIFGNGVFTRADGTRCEAQFYNSRLYGKGSCRYKNGDRYQGELRGAAPHGRGSLVKANGQRFQGEFREGQPFDPKKPK